MADYDNKPQKEADSALDELESKWKNLSTKDRMAEEAVNVATRQIMACEGFKKPRLARLDRYWRLYDVKVEKKLRQLFNVAIPVFPGMVDTLNAMYDSPIQLNFKEGDPSDYFKVKKINGAFQMEIVDTAETSKWDSKLSMLRKHAIMNGRGIIEYSVSSDPEYHSDLENVNLKNFNFQPKGGLYLENHLFAGREDIERTKAELVAGSRNGIYDKAQVKSLLEKSDDTDWLPMDRSEVAEKLNRFRPLGLNADNESYVGTSVFKLASHILEINGRRYYLCFHPWTMTWLRFEP